MLVSPDSANALSPRVLTLPGIVMFFKALQLSKEALPILATLLGIEKLDKLEQPLKK